jgi:hypothetical protein
MSMLSVDEREAIADALRAGKSQNAVAKQFGRGVATINRIAVEYGLEYSAPKHAAEARQTFSQDRRLKLIDDMVDTLYGLMVDVKKAHDFQALVTSAAILIDKRRLEDGEATSRSEVSTDDSRNRVARRVDELAARRRTEGVA